MIKNTPIYIEDSPVYEYRGFMLDTSRHFIPMEKIKKLVEGLNLAKMNKLHLHISDSDSFPMESLSYPDLVDAASFSKED